MYSYHCNCSFFSNFSTSKQTTEKDEEEAKIPTRKDGDGNIFLQMFQRLFNPNQKQQLDDFPTQSLMDGTRHSYHTCDTTGIQSLCDSMNNLDSVDALSVSSV